MTVSKSEITFNSWTGCGYIIIDPSTGEGAYMISGGTNGALIILSAIGVLLIFLASFAVIPSILTIGPFMILSFGTMLEQIIATLVVVGYGGFTGLYIFQTPFFEWVNRNSEPMKSFFTEVIDGLPNVPESLKFIFEILFQ